MKIPCTTCGALILPATAQATGGVCMACKQGLRKTLDAYKAACAAEAERPDPFWALWLSLVDRVHHASEGFSGLSRPEQICYAVNSLLGEVPRGGLYQFFDLQSADIYATAVEGLREIGATRCLELLTAAARALFPGGVIPRDRQAQLDALPQYPDPDLEPEPAWAAELERIGDDFLEHSDDARDRLHAYLVRHQLIPAP
jgi:hypothetical protein